jgi:hypothetical protein
MGGLAEAQGLAPRLRFRPVPGAFRVRRRTDKFAKTVYKFKIPGRRVSISCRTLRPTSRSASPPPHFLPWASGAIVSRRFEHRSERKFHIMQNQPCVASAKNSRAGEELEKAVQSHSPGASAHRIGILMSQTGRFLECIACRLSFAFPPGAHYDTVAKQFDPHVCKSAVSPEDPKSSS